MTTLQIFPARSRFVHARRLAVMILIPAGLATVAPKAQAQTDDEGGRVVNVLQEPRHRTVHRDGDLYLLDVQINPGDTSLAHTHDAPILLTFIRAGSGPVGGRVSSDTTYITEPITHRVGNAGPGLMRIIALTSLGARVPGMQDRPTGMTVEPQLENGWFRSYRIDLAPGEKTPPQTHMNPTVVVQVTDGLVHVSREDGITAELTAMGDWTWRDPRSPFVIENVGSEPVSVVVNEGRRTAAEP